MCHLLPFPAALWGGWGCSWAGYRSPAAIPCPVSAAFPCLVSGAGSESLTFLLLTPSLCCSVQYEVLDANWWLQGFYFFPLKSCAFGSSGGWQPRQVYFCQFIFSLMLLAPLLTLAVALESNGVEWCNTASPRLCVGSFLQGIYLARPRCAHDGGYDCGALSLPAASWPGLEMLRVNYWTQAANFVEGKINVHPTCPV